MTGHRKDMLDIQRIIQLKTRGESNRSIARLLGINRKTVNEYILNLGGANKDFSELSRLDEQSLTSILLNKPQAYQDLQDHDQEQHCLPVHKNLRGAIYYH